MAAESILIQKEAILLLCPFACINGFKYKLTAVLRPIPVEKAQDEKIVVVFINTDKLLTCTSPSLLCLHKLISSEFHLATISRGNFSPPFSSSRLNYASYIIISLSPSRCS